MLSKKRQYAFVFKAIFCGTLIILLLEMNTNISHFNNNREEEITLEAALRVEKKLRLLNNVLETLARNIIFYKQYDELLTKYHKALEFGMCAKYTDDSTYKKFFIPSVWKEVVSIDPDDVTFVSQLSPERIYLVNKTMHRWSGPFSLTLSVKPEELKSLNTTLLLFPAIMESDKIDLHIAIATGIYHPVNFLRNIAIEHSLTENIFLVDLDFIPSPYSHEVVSHYSKQGTLSERKVFVVPAYEFKKDKDFFLPSNRSSTCDLLKDRKLTYFHSFIWFGGHGPTNSKAWCKADEPYEIAYQMSYEPYIVGMKSELPRYNESFVGRYQNKISHLLMVYAVGFRFVVLPNVFLIHHPHPFAGDLKYEHCPRYLYYKYEKDVLKMFPERFEKFKKKQR